MLMEGGYEEKYAIELEYDYKGLYSKFIDRIYFRGKYNLVTEFGLSIRSNYIKSESYTIYRSLYKPYIPKEVGSLNLDDKIRQLLINLTSDILITEEDLIMNEREIKLNEITKKIKEGKRIKNRIKRFFKS
jgi:hypothetical protein